MLVKLFFSVNIIAQRKEIFPQSASSNNLHRPGRKFSKKAYILKCKSKHSKDLGNNFNEFIKLLVSKNIKSDQGDLIPVWPLAQRTLERLGAWKTKM